MRLFELQAIMKECALNTSMVKQYSDLDIYMTCNTGEVQYPIICAKLVYTTIKENTQTYTFQIYIGDRMLEDHSNYNMVAASEIDCTMEWISRLKQSDGIVDVEYDIQLNVGELPQLMDVCLVSYGQITIVTENDYCLV